MPDPFAPSSDPDIPTPTREDLLPHVHASVRDQLAAGTLDARHAANEWGGARRTWDEEHKKEADRRRAEEEAKPSEPPPPAEPELPNPEPPTIAEEKDSTPPKPNLYDIFNAVAKSDFVKFCTPRKDQREKDDDKAKPGAGPDPKPKYPHGDPRVGVGARRNPDQIDWTPLQPAYDKFPPGGARPPKPEHTDAAELFRPNRGWFLAAAGAVAVYILDRVDAPLWLALVTLAVLIGCALIWPWVEKSGKRRNWFWALLGLYGITTVVLAAIFTAPAQPTQPLQPSGTKDGPATSLPTPLPTPSVLPTPSPVSKASPAPSYFSGRVSLTRGEHRLYDVLKASHYVGPSALETLEFYNPSDVEVCWRMRSWGARCLTSGDGYNFPGGADATLLWLRVEQDAMLDIGLKSK